MAKQFVLSHRIYYQNLIQIDTVQQFLSSFSVFLVILGDIDPKKFFKKSQTLFTVIFWDALQHIKWKKIKDSEGHG